ncbi:MAG: FAD-dependent oxidoreductase [Solirubrobacterales bacterium]|nr:FAD-dependent oxidoreductase [Solirubrobacterales bacterium]
MAPPLSRESPATTSWWLREVGPLAPVTQLEGDLRSDVCIVGGGFTGLWTALALKELQPELDVTVVEADHCGTGASGRNGGFVMSLWHQFLALEHACGAPGALWLARASTAAVADIGAFCEEHGIAAQYRPDGWLWTATNAAQAGAWERTIQAIESHGVRPFQRIGTEELQVRTGSRAHLAGVFESTCSSIQPAALARGLLRVARERGVTVFERSPIVGLERSKPLAVRTARGRVTADRVVVAMNAWAGQLQELRRAFAVVSSDVVITEPAADELERIGWRDGVCISDSRLMVHYYRTTREGRVAFGKGGGLLAYDARVGRSFSGRSPLEPLVTARLRSTYPALASVPIAASWTGPIDRTVDGLPFFFALGRPDLVCGAGYSGNGVGPSALGGRILASLVLGRDDEWSRCGLVRKPPRGMPSEPLRYLGGRLVRAAVARKERAEDEDRRPARIDRALAGLAPAGLVPLR